MSKQLKERVQIGTDDFGKPIYKWASGTNKQELFLSVAKLLLQSGQMGAKPPSKEKHPYQGIRTALVQGIQRACGSPLDGTQLRTAT